MIQAHVQIKMITTMMVQKTRIVVLQKRAVIITHLGSDGLYTGQRKVLQTFPETLVKKAAIIDSPRTANILFKQEGPEGPGSLT